MKGKWTKMYHDLEDDILHFLKEKLKVGIQRATFETPKEILVQKRHLIHRCLIRLTEIKTSGNEWKRSWFKRELIERFKYEKDRYREGVQVDGFLEKNVPRIIHEFKQRYQNSNEEEKQREFFDKEFAESYNKEDIVKLLATEKAYAYFMKNEYDILKGVLKIVKKEMWLRPVNHFNDLSSVEVLNFFLQLTQINPKNGKPFITEEQAYALVNLICADKPTSQLIHINIVSDQKKYIVRFVYEFYKYCKDTVDPKGTREKNIAILTNYIAQFSSEVSAQIYPNNFYQKQPHSPIKVDDKCKRWMNA